MNTQIWSDTYTKSPSFLSAILQYYHEHTIHPILRNRKPGCRDLTQRAWWIVTVYKCLFLRCNRIIWRKFKRGKGLIMFDLNALSGLFYIDRPLEGEQILEVRRMMAHNALGSRVLRLFPFGAHWMKFAVGREERVLDFSYDFCSCDLFVRDLLTGDEIMGL